MPRKENEDECCPSGDELPWAEVAHQEVHRGTREYVARESDEVECRYVADDMRDEVRRVIRQEDLNVERVRLVPANRRPGERVVGHAKQVEAALVPRRPE